MTKPVLYLDVDDTILTYHPRLCFDRLVAVPGAKEFIEWALEHFEVRWLTAWCSSGEMNLERLEELAHALGLPVERLEQIHGLPWFLDNKCNGIAWLEHFEGRPWVWIEDDLLTEEIDVLAGNGALHKFIRCNVTEDLNALKRTREVLERWLDELRRSHVDEPPCCRA